MREAARKQIEDDLATYTEKFEKHAVEAIESLNMHVDEIATVAMELKKPEVESQLTRLDQLIGNELQDLKATIINLAKSHQPGVTEEEKQKNKLETFDQLFMATKKVTTLVKEAVQNMRWDSQRFLASVYDEVAAAADTHIEKVDNLIDSGIQELGMKWAWQNDGVTYKDWARYQELKKEFSGIRAKVIKAAERNQRLQEVTNWAEGDSWEAGAYNMAKAATAELARLKRVGKKKIERNDYSGDFSDICLTQQASEEDTPVMGLQENVEAVVGEANSGGIPQEVLQEVDQGVDSEMVQEGVLEAKSDAVEGDTQFESGKTEGTAEAVVPAQSEQEQVPIHQEAAEPIALVPIEEADVQLPDEAAAEPFHFRPSEGAYVHHPEGAAEPIAPVPAEEAYVQPLEGAAEDVTSVPTAEEHSSQEVGEAEASAIPGTDKAASSTQVAEPLPIPLPEVEEIVNWANEELSRIMDNALPLISSHEPGVLEDAIQKSAKVTELAFEAISLAIYGTDEAKPTNTPSGNDEAVSSGNKNAEYVAERRYLNQMRRAAEAILKQNVEYAYQLLVLTHEETKYAMPAEVPDAAEGAKDVAGLGDNMVTEETKASNGDIKDEL